MTMSLTLGDLTPKNVEQLKQLYLVLFPVRYGDKFYNDVATSPSYFTKFAMYKGMAIGGVSFRLENEDGMVKCYIMTLGILAPYRRMGFARKLLEYVYSVCREETAIQEIYLHVQVNNDDGIEFYKRNDFEVGPLIRGYYKRIEPADCYILQRRIRSECDGELTTEL